MKQHSVPLPRRTWERPTRSRAAVAALCCALLTTLAVWSPSSDASTHIAQIDVDSDSGGSLTIAEPIDPDVPRLPDPPIPRHEPDEDLRQQAVDQMVAALESYGDANATYLVDGGGSRGRGSGWAFFAQPGSNYPVSTASVLVGAGHLPPDHLHDPLWTSIGSVKGDVLIYRCKDRVAVFTREGNRKPTPEDADWWTDNGCIRYPIDRLNATYYKVSRPFPKLPDPPLPPDHEPRRQEAVDQMVRALESYGTRNGTYLVSGGGSRGGGAGWAFFERAGTNYSVSTASVLTQYRHLPSSPLHDPLWTSNDSVAGDVLIYRCNGRVAVFTREGNGQPSAEDSAWWTDNGCTRYPIDRLNAKYYKVSQPIGDPDDEQRQRAVDQMVEAFATPTEPMWSKAQARAHSGEAGCSSRSVAAQSSTIRSPAP